MPLTDPDLWSRIAGHRLRAGKSALSTHLRGDHGIRAGTAQAVMTEYRRFLYLTAIATTRMVPSRAVDAVWHAHLEAGRADYDALCKVIGRSIGHVPGTPKGHGSDYRRTRALYAREFDAAPPAQWWGTGGRGVGWLVAGLLCGGWSLFLALGPKKPVPAGIFGAVAAIALFLAFLRNRLALRPAALRDPPRRRRDSDGVWFPTDGGVDCGSADCGSADCGGGDCGGD